MRIIDTHAHIYPDSIAEKATRGIGGFYGLTANADGTTGGLLALMKKYGVYKAVVCSVATSGKQVVKINDYMASRLSVKEFHPLATLHPDMEYNEIKDEAARIKDIGLKGIKLHPDCQNFKLSGERGRKLFDALGNFDLPILVHTGDRRFDNSHPRYMIEIARDYPHITFIAAHFGGWTEWEDALKYKGLKNVWFDTSSTLGHLDDTLAKTVMLGLGIERFTFGTDYPLWNYGEEIEHVLKLDLGEKNNEMVFHKNAEKLFGING